MSPLPRHSLPQGLPGTGRENSEKSRVLTVKAEPRLNCCIEVIDPPEQMVEDSVPVPGSITTSISTAPLNTTFIIDIITGEIGSDDEIYPEEHLVSQPAVIEQFSPLSTHDSLPHIPVAVNGQELAAGLDALASHNFIATAPLEPGLLATMTAQNTMVLLSDNSTRLEVHGRDRRKVRPPAISRGKLADQQTNSRQRVVLLGGSDQ